jgi:uncharacterized protein YgbK (DUF1537 family)
MQFGLASHCGAEEAAFVSGSESFAVREQIAAACVHRTMKIDLDILAVATQLVGEFGDRAVGFCHARFVEHVAVNNVRAADFWRQAMNQADMIVREGRPTTIGFGDRAETLADLDGRAAV